ncbi:hypothetical protein ACF3OH_12470 [Chryseomicrobium aureum]|uniref:hypothetical protein n=1 Tax=Chryseomicrobium aureum TaxID=1441723 RepID=UPI00370D3E1C
MKKWHYINPENYSPAAIIALSFLVTIFTGTALLNLPIAHIGELSVIDAFFFATSATTVTGLGVADTATTFTTFGEVVLMFLMQFGGIGFIVVLEVVQKKRFREWSLHTKLMISGTLVVNALAMASCGISRRCNSIPFRCGADCSETPALTKEISLLWVPVFLVVRGERSLWNK